MERKLKQYITGYEMPGYVSTILVNNYCDSFLKMNILKDRDTYMFNYDAGIRDIIHIKSLSTREKVELIETLLELGKRNDDHMLKGEDYLLEPELVYTLEGRVDKGSVKLLYYPDSNGVAFNTKLCIFADKIMSDQNENEEKTITRIKEALAENDAVKARRIIDRYKRNDGDAAEYLS